MASQVVGGIHPVEKFLRAFVHKLSIAIVAGRVFYEANLLIQHVAPIAIIVKQVPLLFIPINE